MVKSAKPLGYLLWVREGESGQDVGASTYTETNEAVQAEVGHHEADLFRQLVHGRVHVAVEQQPQSGQTRNREKLQS